MAAQAAYLRYLGTAPGAEVIEIDSVYAVRTRVISNTENGVLSDANLPRWTLDFSYSRRTLQE